MKVSEVVMVEEIPKSCRICEHFVRVKEPQTVDKIRKRGFCLYGQGEGDFALYIDSTTAQHCPFYNPTPRSLRIYGLEQELQSHWEKKRGKFWDGRTRAGRMIRHLVKTKYSDSPLGWLQAEKEVLDKLYEEFLVENRELMDKLNSLIPMDGKTYQALILTFIRRASFVVKELEGGVVNAPDTERSE